MFLTEDMKSFEKIKVNRNLLDEIWTLDPMEIDHIDGAKISSYAIALSQYLIFFTFQKNKARAEHYRLSKYIDRTVSLIIAGDETFKKIKTKSTATEVIISTNESLMEAQGKLEEIDKELMYIEGMDKNISELVATLKRELTRRENELYSIRMERK